MSPMVIAVVVFIGVTALVGAVAVAMRDFKTPKAEDRLAAFTTGKRKTVDGEQADIWKKQAFDTDKRTFLDGFMPQLPTLEKIFQQADVNIKPSALTGFAILLAALGILFGLYIGFYILLLPIVALFMFSLPWFWLLWKRRQRLKKFGAQLPDALELVARALRAGHSLAAGMHVVAEEMPAPVATEFGRVYEEQNLGIPLEESMKNMCDRVPNIDLRFFVTSVAIQRQTGGDLAEILDKIGYVIRERFRILGQVKALTGEGRLSGVVLILLPFVLFFIVMGLNPRYIALLWETKEGIIMLVVGLIMQLVGALVIRWIVNIKV
jgi:tight adherence protein B